MEQGASDKSKTADPSTRTMGEQLKKLDDATEIVPAAGNSFDANEEEIHLDYDGLSDDNLNDSSEKKLNDSFNQTTNENDEEMHLTYDGVSDDTLNDSKNSSNKEENGINQSENCNEITIDIEDERRQVVHDNEESSSLAHGDNKFKSSLVSDDDEDASMPFDDTENDSVEHDHNEEINNRLVLDKNTDDKHDRSTPKDKQAIQSQQQRLQREAQFSIPYHKPKKYTLKEFLNRRTIMKPDKAIEENSGLEKRLGKSRNLKMTKEELEVYSKLMEDRAKEASEFFKAENSENSKDETTVIESSDGPTKHKNKSVEIDNSSIDKAKVFEAANDNKEYETTQCEKRNTTHVIITEVLELPKLDLTNVATDLNLREIVQQSLSPPAKKPFSLDANRVLKADLLKTSPVLNKNVDITIDLFSNEDTISKPISRANSLLERLMKTNNCKSKPKEDVKSLLSPSVNNKSLIEKPDPGSHKKPGETLLQLKDNLKSLIMKKRREEIMKKQEEDKKNVDLEDDDFDEDAIDDEEELDDELEPTSSENSDSESAAESAHELDDDDKNGDNGNSNILIDESQTIPAAQVELGETDIEPRIGLSFNESLSEPQTPGTSARISQIPATQIANQEEDTEQLIDLCSGTFETQPVTATTTQSAAVVKSNQIISSSSDEEENSPLSNSKKSRNKRFTKKAKKSKMKLGFSDDEDDDNDGVDENDNDDKSEATDEENVEHNAHDDDNLPATYIDYDSEENEITVELTKEDRLKRAENFVEKEAELSDSEWGSADEDEKNLDQYDIELGDEDEFDKEEVRAQLEQIHARKMLDEDIRQVNKLQEILFEDEEDESAKRQRKFRWKNFDTAFNIDLSQNQLTDLKPEEGSDDENEHLWRKIRYEREQAIKNNSLSEISLEASTSITTPKATSDMKNLTILTMSTKTKISGTEEKEKSPFLISKELIKSENIKARSSFLLRNKKTLTKTISSVKNGNNDVNTSEDKIGVKAINPSKFVFTTLSLEEHETLKRKADDTNAGIDIKNVTKRLKQSETRKSEYLIDKLL